MSQPHTLLNRAVALAATAHAGQVDKAGRPYIFHPLRVLESVRQVDDPDVHLAAVLHDVVEDCAITPQQLLELGFPPRAVEAVTALTKRLDEEGGDEGYFRFVRRAAEHPAAIHVKLADVRDNLDVRRLGQITERDERRLVRYYRAQKLLEALLRAQGPTPVQPPIVLPLRGDLTLTDIEAECPGGGAVYVADFHVAGIEAGERVPGGLRVGRVTAVDHHADRDEMHSPAMTSTALAADLLRAGGGMEPGRRVVVNHCDCDSMLSSAMLMGWLTPDESLVHASRCADHTGEANDVADLLQALDESRGSADRTDADWLASWEALRALRAGEPLPPHARTALALRRMKRAAARRLVEDGRVQVEGGVALARVDDELDGALLAPLVPDAAVVMLAMRLPGDASRWLVKLRLGRAARPGLTLPQLGIGEFDPAYGGRWNAGSNRRPKAGVQGGTAMDPEAYAAELRRRLAR